MAMGSINGQMVVCIKETGSITKYQVMVSTLGTISVPIKDICYIIICMAQEFINGQMVESMKVII